MCVYSMVHDWAQTLPPDYWDRRRLAEYEELIRRLKKIDEQIGLPDCNPNKGEFLEEIRRRLDSIERKLGMDTPLTQVTSLGTSLQSPDLTILSGPTLNDPGILKGGE